MDSGKYFSPIPCKFLTFMAYNGGETAIKMTMRPFEVK